MILLALDPGIRGCGVALFDGMWLLKAAFVPNSIRVGNSLEAIVEMARCVAAWAPYDPQALAVEWPQIYRGKSIAGDLMPLAGIGAALAAMLCRARPIPLKRYLPHEWKGSVNPEILIQRVQNRLTPTERGGVELPRDSLAHNVWDAVGIGLFYVGRLQSSRVVARGQSI